MADGGHEHDEDVPEHHVDDSKLLLPSVKLVGSAVATGEEDEEVVLAIRGKMYRVREGEWKERGLGDIKILKHKAANRQRIVLRQEKTGKVVANHLVTMEAKFHPDSDKSVMYSAVDNSDGTPAEESLLIRFKTSEMAAQFKSAYDTAFDANSELGGDFGDLSTASAPDSGSGSGAGGAGGPAAAVSGGAAKPVPVVQSLADIYGAEKEGDMNARYAGIAQAFVDHFHIPPTVFVRAPGRVNLIGEHIDYHGYAVMPMALTQDVVIAVAITSPSEGIRVANTNSKFEPETLPVDPASPVTLGKWTTYAHSGYKGAFDACTDPAKKASPVGLALMYDGTVPPAAGVSSSSALVVATTLAVSFANGIKYTRGQLAEAAQLCELYAGLIGGGMDQAISCLAEAGSAQMIEFDPIRGTDVTMPPGGVIVVGNSLVHAAKVALGKYNIRVVEGKLAAKLTAKKLGIESWRDIKTITELQHALKLSSPGELVAHFTAQLKAEPYSLSELAGEANLGADLATLFEGDRKKEGVIKTMRSMDSSVADLELLRRARHVASEAELVYEFRRVCEAEPVGDPLVSLGGLLNASHASCRDDYDCSCPDLDRMCELAQANGAVGARLTGAGWGGCMIALVPEAKVESYMAAMTAEYYTPKGISGPELAAALFASPPSNGAMVYTSLG